MIDRELSTHDLKVGMRVSSAITLEFAAPVLLLTLTKMPDPSLSAQTTKRMEFVAPTIKEERSLIVGQIPTTQFHLHSF